MANNTDNNTDNEHVERNKILRTMGQRARRNTGSLIQLVFILAAIVIVLWVTGLWGNKTATVGAIFAGFVVYILLGIIMPFIPKIFGKRGNKKAQHTGTVKRANVRVRRK